MDPIKDFVRIAARYLYEVGENPMDYLCIVQSDVIDAVIDTAYGSMRILSTAWAPDGAMFAVHRRHLFSLYGWAYAARHLVQIGENEFPTVEIAAICPRQIEMINAGGRQIKHIHVGVDPAVPGADVTAFTCPICQLATYNKNDIAYHYCGRCHQFF